MNVTERVGSAVPMDRPSLGETHTCVPMVRSTPMSAHTATSSVAARPLTGDYWCALPPSAGGRGPGQVIQSP